jgi:hypothetical protein|tara:strand:+ start:2366 stop:4795 length:2430 start_codon:yes stop_codon:yes gene_type:complete
MANKYSRYQLQPFVSQYVDPQSVQVNDVLRKRYDQNKQGKDMIDRTLAQLQVMEGDKALVEDAKKQVKGVLNNVNEQGNYEDAGLAIQDAANHVDQDPGIIAAKKSYENRAQELDFLRKARMEGKQVLDFGQGASKNHVSYYFDKNTETFQSNIYEPASEQRLDYDAEMSGLLKTIKADSNGQGWEGITVGKADRVAAMMYGNYLESDAGKQDFRRLVELDLPGSLSDEQKNAMAKRDIMNRLKGFTRQYVYNKITAPKAGEGGTSALGLPSGIMTSGTTSTKGITNDKPQLQALQNLSILSNPNMSDEDKMARIQFNQGMMDDSVKAYLMNQGEAGQDKLDRWSELQKAHNQSGDEKFFELTKMLTINTYDSSTDYGNVFNQAGSRGMQMAGAGMVGGASYGAAGGSFVVPGVGTAVGGIAGGLGGGLIGGVSGFVGGVAEGIAMEMDKFRNVRDWHRASTANNENGDSNAMEGLWGLFVDSEEDQLLEELFGDEDDGDMDVKKINDALGTNYTKADIPRLKELAMGTYSWMAAEDNGITGDAVMENIKENGMTLTQSGYTTDGGSDGEKVQKALNKTIINSDPFQDWNIFGVTEKKDMEEFLGTDKDGNLNMNLWQGGQVTDVYEADPLTNQPLRFQFRNKNGISKIMELKPGRDLQQQLQSGILGNTALKMGLPNLAYQEAIRQELVSIKRQTGQNANIGQYIDLQAQYAAAGVGGTQETVLQYQRLYEDQYLLDIILGKPEYSSQFVKDEQGMLYLQSEGKNLPWMVNGKLNESVWSLYQKQNPTLVSQLRTQMRNRSTQEVAYK